MRKIIGLILGISLITTAAWAAGGPAKTVENEVIYEVTGLEWLEMSMGQRMDQVLASMMALRQRGLEPSRDLNDYYNELSEALKMNPSLYSMSLTEILEQNIRQKESTRRKVLASVEKKPDFRKIATH